MTDARHNGFLFEHFRPDANSVGGKRRSELIVIAATAGEAIELVDGTLPNASLIDSGPTVLARALADDLGYGQVKWYD